MINYNDNFYQRTNSLKIRINNKYNDLIFEPNKFDLFINKIFNMSYKLYLIFKNTFMNNLLTKIISLAKNKFITNLGSTKNFLKSSNDLEKKIEEQRKIIIKTTEFNRELFNRLGEFDEKLNSVISRIAETKNSELDKKNMSKDDFKNKINNNTNNNKLNILQEENLRISNELFESRKKIEIMKQEVEKFNTQRTNLIDKINSVNEIVSDSNVLTSVFDNNLEKSKIKVIDPNKPIIKKSNLDEEVKKIFSKS